MCVQVRVIIVTKLWLCELSQYSLHLVHVCREMLA